MGHCRHFNSRSRVRSSRRPSRGARVRVLIAVGAGLLLAACSAPAQPEGPPEIPEGVTGLAVRVSGLPVGEPAAVRVLREGITIAELDGSANLENIEVGTYSIEADDIGVAGSVYLANPPVQGAEVEAGSSVKVEVAYTLQDPDLGSLKVELKGLPTGSRARVTLRGSSGKDQAQDGGPYVTFTNLEPGSYQVEAGAAAHGAATFEPDRSPISVVVGSAQSNATFDFACATVDPPDPGLEAAFRDALGKQAGPLACSDVANMEYVDASARGIVDLEGLQYTAGLLTLNLDDNLLEALAPGHFASLERLKFLILGANRIADLPAEAFRGLSELIHLDLSGNPLGAIASTTFAGLTSLQTLGLQDVDLAELPPGLFDDLSGLLILTLRANEIESLSVGVFTSLTSLTGLDLSENEIARLPAGLFAPLTDLSSLGLAHNRLTDLGNDPFAGLDKLEVLRLDHNLLPTVELDAFDDLTSLVELGLVGNCLRLDKVPVAGILAELVALGADTADNPRTDAPCPPTGAATSRFDSGADGWAVSDKGLSWNPRGYVRIAGASYPFLLSPDRLSGDASDYYGRSLSFRVRTSNNDGNFVGGDVHLQASGDVYAYSLPTEPTTTWQKFEVPLSAGSGWVDYYSGAPASEADLRDALANLARVNIRWRFDSAQDGWGDLDDIVFGD